MLGKTELLNLLNLSQDEAALRKMICEVIGCDTIAPAPLTPAPLALIGGVIAGDAFHMQIPLGADKTLVEMVLDTGAFEMLLTAAVADALGLPNEGSLDVSGVTGSSTAYQSHVAVTLGESTYVIHCVVDPEFTGTPLFGLRFFIDRSLSLTLNTATQTLTITQ